jgi:integrase
MPVVTLTPKFVRASVCTEGRKIDFFDSRQRGLMLEVRETGGKTFYLRYTDERSRERHIKIGPADIIRLRDAREKARTLLAQTILGKNPQEERATRRRIPRYSDFIAERYLPFIKTYKRSWTTDETMLRQHVLPAFSGLHVDEISAEHVSSLVSGMQAAGYASGTVNRAIIITRYSLRLAAKWQVIPEGQNPTRHFRCAADVQRQRFLDLSEVERLIGAINQDCNRLAAPAILLLLLTGARRNEILWAKWEFIDYRAKTLLVPLSKSGKPRQIVLSDDALSIIGKIGRTDNPYLFPLPETGAPPKSLFFPWERMRKRAGLENVRLHDLRHTYASLLVNDGISLFVVQNLLGHANCRATQRYSHLNAETLAHAAGLVASSIRRRTGNLLDNVIPGGPVNDQDS